MTDLYIKNSSNIWESPRELIVKKDSITWTPVNGAYINTATGWVKVYPSSGSIIYSTSGIHTFTVPNGIYNLNIQYPTPTGLITVPYVTSPGSIISANIGSSGTASTFGTLNIPAFDTTVFTFGGNVDINDYFTIRIGSASGTSFTSSGYAGTHSAAATAKGAYLLESSEISHGDLPSTITMDPIPNTALVGTVCSIYLTNFSGRYSFVITQQPSQANNYTAKWTPDDHPIGGEGYYSYHIKFKQVVSLNISW